MKSCWRRITHCHCHTVKLCWMFKNAFQPSLLWYTWKHVVLYLLRNNMQGWVYRYVSFHCTECWGRGYHRSCCQFSSVFCIIVKWKSSYDICAPHSPLNSVLLNMSCLNSLQFLQMTQLKCELVSVTIATLNIRVRNYVWQWVWKIHMNNSYFNNLGIKSDDLSCAV